MAMGMTKILIPLKFKQIAIDNFPNIPDDAPIIKIIAIAGTKTGVTLPVLVNALSWLRLHGDAMDLKDGVTPGKGLKRLCSCLEIAIEQTKDPQTEPPKPTKNQQKKRAGRTDGQ
jgi:hypothetical protein